MILDFKKPELAKLLDLESRYDVLAYVDVLGGTLNGDPDAGARSRRDPTTGHGIVTDVACKRVIRDNSQYLIENGFEALHGKVPGSGLYVSHRGVLNENHQKVYAATGVQGYSSVSVVLAGKALEQLVPGDVPAAVPQGYTVVRAEPAKGETEPGPWTLTFDGTLDAAARGEALSAFGELGAESKKVAEKLTKGAKTRTLTDVDLAMVTNKLCDMYFDVRTFGAVATTGDSCGAVRGPWQFTQGTSVEPLDDPTQAITRVAVTKVEDKVVKRQEMGRRNPTAYALYRFTAFYSPTMARRSRITVQDLKLFWSALANFGREQASSLRGHVSPVGLYVFAHNHPMGLAHAHELFDRIRHVRLSDAPRSGADYRIAVDGTDLPRGVSLVKLYERARRQETEAPVDTEPARVS